MALALQVPYKLFLYLLHAADARGVGHDIASDCADEGISEFAESRMFIAKFLNIL